MIQPSAAVKNVLAELEPFADIRFLQANWNVPAGLACMSLGSVAIYSLMFATGHLICGNIIYFAISAVAALVSSVFLFRLWGRLFS